MAKKKAEVIEDWRDITRNGGVTYPDKKEIKQWSEDDEIEQIVLSPNDEIILVISYNVEASKYRVKSHHVGKHRSYSNTFDPNDVECELIYYGRFEELAFDEAENYMREY